jgi:hypothetical protein
VKLRGHFPYEWTKSTPLLFTVCWVGKPEKDAGGDTWKLLV